MAKSKQKKYFIMWGELPDDVVVWPSTSDKLLSDIEKMAEEYSTDVHENIRVYEIAGEFDNFTFEYPDDPPPPFVVLKNPKGKKP